MTEPDDLGVKADQTEVDEQAEVEEQVEVDEQVDGGSEVEGEQAEVEPDAPDLTEHRLAELVRRVEALLFLSPQSVSVVELASAIEATEAEIEMAVAQLAAECAPGRRGIQLRQVGGGWALASEPEAEDAARRLLTKPRTPPLTQAQAESLAIIAYLQPVARPEIARIRGVASDSALNALSERGLIEEAGRSRFGAVIYTTTPLFLRLFGLGELGELPDPNKFDPSPEDEREIRERLIKAGEQRSES